MTDIKKKLKQLNKHIEKIIDLDVGEELEEQLKETRVVVWWEISDIKEEIEEQ